MLFVLPLQRESISHPVVGGAPFFKSIKNIKNYRIDLTSLISSPAGEERPGCCTVIIFCG